VERCHEFGFPYQLLINYSGNRPFDARDLTTDFNSPRTLFTRLWHPPAFLPCQSNEFGRLLLASEFRRKNPPYR
jgi:hypothetical protein